MILCSLGLGKRGEALRATLQRQAAQNSILASGYKTDRDRQDLVHPQVAVPAALQSRPLWVLALSSVRGSIL